MRVLVTIAMLLVISAPVYSQSYKVERLPALPGHISSGANSINNLGQVVGQSSPTQDLDTDGAATVVWQANQVLKLPVSSEYSSIFGGYINDRSQIVASATGVDQMHSADGFWSLGSNFIEIPRQANMDEYYVAGINALGMIYGLITFTDNRHHGFLYDSIAQTLDMNPTYRFEGITTNGLLLRLPTDNQTPNWAPQVVRPNGTITLQAPQGYHFNYNLGNHKLSENGFVAGGASALNGVSSRCFRWSPPNYTPQVISDNPVVEGSYCEVAAVNARGDVLMNYSLPGGQVLKLRKQDGTFTSLSDLFQAEAYGRGLNDLSQIVGTEYGTGSGRAFLLTPKELPCRTLKQIPLQ